MTNILDFEKGFNVFLVDKKLINQNATPKLLAIIILSIVRNCKLKIKCHGCKYPDRFISVVPDI